MEERSCGEILFARFCRRSLVFGTCAGSLEEWKVPEWIVTTVTVTPKSLINLANVGIDYRRFRTERIDPQRKEILAYYDKLSGVAISAFGKHVDSIYLFPSQANYGRLCDNPKVKSYYASKRWARVPMPKNLIIDYNIPADVIQVDLASAGGSDFSVSTKVVNPDNDILTYSYKISAGKIIGAGANVVWHLSGVGAGNYTITAAVDDGMGFSGKYVTKTVTIP